MNQEQYAGRESAADETPPTPSTPPHEACDVSKNRKTAVQPTGGSTGISKHWFKRFYLVYFSGDIPFNLPYTILPVKRLSIYGSPYFIIHIGGDIMRSLTLTILLFAFPLLAHSSVIEVPKDYPTIQAAIDAAVNGDTRPGAECNGNRRK